LRPEQRDSTRARVRSAAMVVLLASVAAVFVWRGRQSGPAEAPGAVGDPPPARTSPAPPPPQPPARDPVPTPGFRAELTTARPVWVRVVVDGERRIERELPAGQKIPLTAREMIAVRAGDAGAVRLSINGEDQGPVGQDGAVATRTFTKPR
jgi:hypothetical protein